MGVRKMLSVLRLFGTAARFARKMTLAKAGEENNDAPRHAFVNVNSGRFMGSP